VLRADSSAKTATIAVVRIDSPLLASLVDLDGLIGANALADTAVDALVLIAVAHRRDVVALSLESLESTAADLADVLETLALAVLDKAVVDLLEDLGTLVDGSSAHLDGRSTSEHELDDVVPGGNTTDTDDGDVGHLASKSRHPVDGDGADSLAREPALAAWATEDGDLTLDIEHHARAEGVHEDEAIDTAGTELLGEVDEIVAVRRKLGEDRLLGEALDGSGVGASVIEIGVVAGELVGVDVLLHVGDELLGVLSVVAERADQRDLLADFVSTDLGVLTALAVPGLRGHVGPELDVEHALGLAVIGGSHAGAGDLCGLDADGLGDKTTAAVLSRGVEDGGVAGWGASSSENRGSEFHAQDGSLQKICVSHCYRSQLQFHLFRLKTKKNITN